MARNWLFREDNEMPTPPTPPASPTPEPEEVGSKEEEAVARYWTEFYDSLDNPTKQWLSSIGSGDPHQWNANIAGAILVGCGAFYLAKKWKDFRRAKAQAEGISLSPELDRE